MRSLEVEEKEGELRRKIVQWKRDIQPTYMPGMPSSGSTVSADVDAEDAGNDYAGDVWDVPLCLPSSFTSEQRFEYCASGLEEKERRLRFAQADDALIELRRVLRTVLTLDKHRSTQTAGSGVAANTRMQNLLSKQRSKQHRLAERYRAARNALVRLDPVGACAEHGWGARLKVLNDSDIKPPAAETGTGEGYVQLTWIWLTASGSSPDGEHDEGLRTEWAKSLARAERWEEEVVLIPIEMRRVLRNMLFRAREWRLKAQTAIPLSMKSVRIQAAYAAYSEKQAFILEELAQDYATLWLSLFEEYDMGTPSGWPHMCAVKRPVKRRVERRRDRMKTKLQARAVAESPQQPIPSVP